MAAGLAPLAILRDAWSLRDQAPQDEGTRFWRALRTISCDAVRSACALFVWLRAHPRRLLFDRAQGRSLIGPGLSGVPPIHVAKERVPVPDERDRNADIVERI